MLCGCRSILLQCRLVCRIKEIYDELVPVLLGNEPNSHKKYVAYTDHSCANRNQIYERKHVYQTYLRQMLN